VEKIEAKLMSIENKKETRKVGCGRKAFYPDLEKILFQLFKIQRIDNRNLVNYRRITEREREREREQWKLPMK